MYLVPEDGVSCLGVMAVDGSDGPLEEADKLQADERGRENGRVFSYLPCRSVGQQGHRAQTPSSAGEAVWMECSEHLHTLLQVSHYV